MTNSVPRTARFLLAIAIVLGAGACSASAEVEPSTATAAEPAATAVVVAPTPTPVLVAPTPSVAESTVEDDAGSTTAAPAEVAEPTSNGTVEIAFEDGRTWSLNTIDCYTSPDSPFGIFFMGGVNDGGAELNVVESWPLDGDKSRGTSFIASLIDEDGTLFVVEGGPVVEDGNTLSFTSPIYEGLSFEPFTTGTFTCTP